MSAVWELDLPRDEKIVLLALADHAHDDGTSVRPSVSTVARKCGYSARSIHRKFDQLRERGLLAVEEADAGRPVEYRIILEGCDKLSGVTAVSDPPLPSSVRPPSDTAMADKPSVQPSEEPSLFDDMAPKNGKPSPTRTAYPDHFEQVWKAHPRGSKKKAYDEYRRAVFSNGKPARIKHADLVHFLQVYVDTELSDRFKGHDLFRWIRDDRWEQERAKRPTQSNDPRLAAPVNLQDYV